MKKIFILFSTILLIISLGGCSMFINRKAIAEKALQEQYGEEFVAYHTWDHGGDSFRASMYPKADESIKFNTHIFNDGRIIIDYYAEKIVGKEIIEIIKPYIDEIAEESAYFATVPIQDLGYTSKEEVSIEDFYTKAEKDESDWPYIYIAINIESVNHDITFEDEYEIILRVLSNVRLDTLDGIGLVLYYVRDGVFSEYTDIFSSEAFFDPQIYKTKKLQDLDKKIFIQFGNGDVNVSLNNYIEKRKEFTYE